MLGQPRLQPLVFFRQIKQVKMDAAASDVVPDAAPFLNGVHRRQRLNPQFRIDPAPRQVVDDVNIMPLIGQVQCCGPANEAVTTENCDFHDLSSMPGSVSHPYEAGMTRFLHVR